MGYLSVTVTSGIRAELGVLGGRASGKEDGNAVKCASHVWWKNKETRKQIELNVTQNYGALGYCEWEVGAVELWRQRWEKLQKGKKRLEKKRQERGGGEHEKGRCIKCNKDGGLGYR